MTTSGRDKASIPELASCTARDIALLDTVLFLWSISSNSTSDKCNDDDSRLHMQQQSNNMCGPDGQHDKHSLTVSQLHL